MSSRVYTREFKLEICRLASSKSRTITSICGEFHLANSVFYRWFSSYKHHGEAAFLPPQSPQRSEAELLQDRVEELERHCGRLSLENSLLKKSITKAKSQKCTS